MIANSYEEKRKQKAVEVLITEHNSWGYWLKGAFPRMGMVRMQSPKFFSQTSYFFQTSFHLVFLSCHFFTFKVPIVYIFFKFFKRLKQPLSEIPFHSLAFKCSIGMFLLRLWLTALGLSFFFTTGLLHDVVSCLTTGTKCRDGLLCYFWIAFALKHGIRPLPHTWLVHSSNLLETETVSASSAFCPISFSSSPPFNPEPTHLSVDKLSG